MNKKQRDLVIEITSRMLDPMKQLMTSNDYDDVINEDGVAYVAIVCSILSSLIATSSENLIKETFEFETDDQFMYEFGKIVDIISVGALYAKNEHDKKRSFH